VPLLLEKLPGPLHRRAEFGQEFRRHVPGFDGLRHAAEEPLLKAILRLGHVTLHGSVHRLRASEIDLDRVFRLLAGFSEEDQPLQCVWPWRGLLVCQEHGGPPLPDLLGVEAVPERLVVGAESQATLHGPHHTLISRLPPTSEHIFFPPEGSPAHGEGRAGEPAPADARVQGAGGDPQHCKDLFPLQEFGGTLG